ncbi:dihydrodipicolinate synthase family protein [Agromyces sp. NPDC056965]|uniref:dihydrodipicolinate synthase family protein n=1 Tax=Agromyces sp. NPDC056965 TaxID=3345983 RepID=UPI00363C22BC
MAATLDFWAATITPFDEYGRLDLAPVRFQAQKLTNDGVVGAFVTGTTGEFASLSSDERKAIVEEWRDVRHEGLEIGVQVGHTELAQAQQLAAHAESNGADLIAAIAPFYGETSSIDRIVSFLADVAAAAPATPFCFYHIPSMTGSSHRPSDVMASAIDKIPTLQAVKFTDEDLMEFDRVRLTAPHVRVFFGRDELLPAGMAFGADGVIGSLYNGLAPIGIQVARAFSSGDTRAAFSLHAPFREVAAAAGRHGGLGFVRQLMNELGPDSGPGRLPWGPLNDADQRVARELAVRLREPIENARRELADGRGASLPSNRAESHVD